MPRFLNTFLFTGAIYGLGMGIYSAIATDWPILVIIRTALLGGLLFGLALAGLTWLLQRWTKLSIQWHEPILQESMANHLKGLEAVGGGLYLTNRRLIFKSHPLNFQNHEISIPLSNIIEVQPCKTYGIFPNGLQILTRNGRTEHFLMAERGVWIERITARLK